MNSIAAIAIGVGAIAAAAWRGALDPAHLASSSGTAAFLVGLLAALAVDSEREFEIVAATRGSETATLATAEEALCSA